MEICGLPAASLFVGAVQRTALAGATDMTTIIDIDETIRAAMGAATEAIKTAIRKGGQGCRATAILYDDGTTEVVYTAGSYEPIDSADRKYVKIYEAKCSFWQDWDESPYAATGGENITESERIDAAIEGEMEASLGEDIRDKVQEFISLCLTP
jgi:hypothetical protein